MFFFLPLRELSPHRELNCDSKRPLPQKMYDISTNYIVGLHEPFNVNSSVISPKNQLALILYFFRVYLKCK